MSRPHIIRRLKARHLLNGHHAGMVVLMAGEGQSHALDGVGKKAGRLVAHRRMPKSLGQGAEIMPGEVGHQGRQRGVA